MFRGFKEFLLRGNVIDLAVAVVIGLAFQQIVQALVDGLINPLIAAIFGETDLSGVWRFELNEAVFSVGLILDAALNFVFVAAGIYFVIVLPFAKLQERRRRGEEPVEAVPEDTALLREIRDLLASRSEGDR
jgi:large conductance mechanosensitive channel